MRQLITAMLIVVSLIHILPAVGVLSRQQLGSLYGITIDEPNLEILMRHRAVLFGVLGVFLLAAAFNPSYHAPALIAGLVSVLSFLWLAWSVGGYNSLLSRVVIADIVALVCLIVGIAAYLIARNQAAPAAPLS